MSMQIGEKSFPNDSAGPMISLKTNQVQEDPRMGKTWKLNGEALN